MYVKHNIQYIYSTTKTYILCNFSCAIVHQTYLEPGTSMLDYQQQQQCEYLGLLLGGACFGSQPNPSLGVNTLCPPLGQSPAHTCSFLWRWAASLIIQTCRVILPAAAGKRPVTVAGTFMVVQSLLYFPKIILWSSPAMRGNSLFNSKYNKRPCLCFVIWANIFPYM